MRERRDALGLSVIFANRMRVILLWVSRRSA
jgi:hypothetical protein